MEWSILADAAPPSLRVMVRLINGDAIEFSKSAHFAQQVEALLDQGLLGRDVVRLLLGEKWSAPPLGMRVTGHVWNGRPIDLTIACW